MRNQCILIVDIESVSYQYSDELDYFDFEAVSKSVDLLARTMRPVLLLLLWMTQNAYCFSPRIIGGHDATINNYPYQVSIHYNGELACGGSIISQNWVLTAAHCIYGLIPTKFQIRLGSSYYNKEGTLISGIKNVIWHENYNSRTYNFDVALIMLPTPISISSTVKPISLAQSTSTIPTKINAIVTGWGYLKANGLFSSRLQYLSAPIVDQNQCKGIFSKIKYDITDNMLCAGSLAGGHDTCKGDSGGPLVYNGVQIGIVSFGYECAKPNYPGVYTRVSAVRDWIKEKAKV